MNAGSLKRENFEKQQRQSVTPAHVMWQWRALQWITSSDIWDCNWRILEKATSMSMMSQWDIHKPGQGEKKAAKTGTSLLWQDKGQEMPVMHASGSSRSIQFSTPITKRLLQLRHGTSTPASQHKCQRTMSRVVHVHFWLKITSYNRLWLSFL